MAESGAAAPLQEQDALMIRRLTHDMNNALEVIVQASYLVNTTELSEPAKEWMRLLDQGIRKASSLNRELHDYIHARS